MLVWKKVRWMDFFYFLLNWIIFSLSLHFHMADLFERVFVERFFQRFRIYDWNKFFFCPSIRLPGWWREPGSRRKNQWNLIFNTTRDHRLYIHIQRWNPWSFFIRKSYVLIFKCDFLPPPLIDFFFIFLRHKYNYIGIAKEIFQSKILGLVVFQRVMFAQVISILCHGVCASESVYAMGKGRVFMLCDSTWKFPGFSTQDFPLPTHSTCYGILCVLCENTWRFSLNISRHFPSITKHPQSDLFYHENVKWYYSQKQSMGKNDLFWAWLRFKIRFVVL